MTPSATPAQVPPARFPLTVSADRRRMLDADDRPFLVQGDAAWSIIVNLSLDEAIAYLDDRQAKGFNTIIVNLIEALFAADAPRNLAGDAPFQVEGDLSTPNPGYFEHADRILEACAERGIAVVLCPTYLGYPDPAYPGYDGREEGWYHQLVAGGVEGGRAWGEFLGQRYRHMKHIIWCIGGDRDADDALPALRSVAEGLRAAGADALFTGHVFPGNSPVDVYAGEDWLDLNVTYTYEIVHRKLLADWQRAPTWPFFLIESTYEGEHDQSDLQIRRQAYWSVLAGGNGHCMGNHPIWLFGSGWREALDAPGSVAMARWGTFFRSLDWAALEPDLAGDLLLVGRGEERGLDRALTAITPGRDLSVTYLPSRRAMRLDLEVLSGEWIDVGWFDPVTGERLTGGTLRRAGTVTVASPFDEDAVLVLRESGDTPPDAR